MQPKHVMATLALGLGLASPLLAITGYVRVPTKVVAAAVVPVDLSISSDWKAAILEAHGETLPSLGLATKTVNDVMTLAIAFAQPQVKDQQGNAILSDNSLIIFVGTYQGGANYLFKGKMLRPVTIANVTDWTATLKQYLNGTDIGTFDKGTFEFSPKTVPVSPSSFAYPYPPSDYRNGVPVYRGFAPSGDNSNPCPAGPCWTDAGVSRHLEYYNGPIQNPGHAMPPATFDTGPNSRASQLEAQMVGIQRARMIYETYGRMASPMWGYFWLMR